MNSIPSISVTAENMLDISSDELQLLQNCQLFEFVLCTAVIGVLCVLGLFGNIISFIVLCKHKPKTVAIFLLQVLAMSDTLLLLCSTVIYKLPSLHPALSGMDEPSAYRYIIESYIWPLSLMTHTTTVYMTILVTLNRYCAVCRPAMSLSGYLLRATKLQVVTVISFAVLYNTPRFFEHQVIRIDEQAHDNSSSTSAFSTTLNATFYNLGDNKIYQIVYSNVIYIPVMYIMPLVSLTYLNYHLMKGLRKICLRKATLTGHHLSQDRHITHIIIIIVCVFIMCQTPALINQIFWAVTDFEQRQCGHFHFYYTKVSDMLVVFNSSTNFVIYCLFGKHFRRIFAGLLRRPRQSTDAIPMQPVQRSLLQDI